MGCGRDRFAGRRLGLRRRLAGRASEQGIELASRRLLALLDNAAPSKPFSASEQGIKLASRHLLALLDDATPSKDASLQHACLEGPGLASMYLPGFPH